MMTSCGMLNRLHYANQKLKHFYLNLATIDWMKSVVLYRYELEAECPAASFSVSTQHTADWDLGCSLVTSVSE